MKNKGTAFLDSDNARVMVTPTSFEVDKFKTRDGFIQQSILLKCDDLHEKARVAAIVEGETETLEASLIVEDVVSAVILEPPEDMEFRPKESKGLPNRKNNLTLLINATVIPPGRKIAVRLLKKQGSIGFIDNQNKRHDQCDIRFEKSHLIEGCLVGRLLVPWQGDGLGQFAHVIAETKTPEGREVSAIAKVLIEQSESKGGGGIIKDVRYEELESAMCSAFAGGTIWINSAHSMNREVFGENQKDYDEMVKTDTTAQYRLSTILVEQGVFQLAEKVHLDGKLYISPDAPITDMRKFVDERTNELAPKIFKVILKKST